MKVPARWRDRLESRRPRADHSLPSAVPLFPVGGLAPDSPCPHFTLHLDEHGARLLDPEGRAIVESTPVRPGSDFCCMVCQSWGHDELLYRDGRPAEPPPLVVRDEAKGEPVAIRMTQRTHDALARRKDGADWLAGVKVEIIPDPPRARRRAAAFAR